MKIAFVLPNLKAGGGNRSQITLANQLSAGGDDVSIIAPKGSVFTSTQQNNVQIVQVGVALRSQSLSAIVNYPIVAFHARHYDVAITTFALTTWYVFLSSLFFRFKVVHYARHYDPLLLDETKIRFRPVLWCYRIITRLSYELPVHLVVNSRWTGEMIVKNTLRKPSYDIINNGIDASCFLPQNQPGSHGGSEKKILVLGKKQRWKGLQDVYAALRILSLKRCDFKLVIMSPDEIEVPDDGCYPTEVIHPITDQEIVDTYRQAAVFVSASWYEGFGNPPLEAMACGIPVVMTDSGGVREYAKHQYNCLLSEPQSPEALANNINIVLAADPCCTHLVHNGLETARRFTWEKSAEKFRNILTN